MSENTKIEWADHTYNHWIGCNPISPGCANCYAADWAKRYGRDFATRTRTKTAGDPVKWNKQHDTFFAEHGRRQRVFCASVSDVFDNQVDPQWRVDLFELIRATPNLDWLLLTKRIGNAQAMIDATISDMDIGHSVPFAAWPYPNVWIGATIVNQEEADRDIPKLLAVPAAKRFLSMEPLLGPVDLRYIDINGDCEIYPLKGTTNCVDGDFEPAPDLPALDWVIVGGESGPGARPMHPDWARDLRDQCEAAGVPFLFKQWGEWSPGNAMAAAKASESIRVERSGTVHPWPPTFDLASGDWCMHRVGKKAAGRELDDRTWDGFPA